MPNTWAELIISWQKWSHSGYSFCSAEAKRNLLNLLCCCTAPKSEYRQTSARQTYYVLYTNREANLKILFDRASQSWFRDSTNDGIKLLSSLEDHHSRNRANAVFSGDARAFICVQLHLVFEGLWGQHGTLGSPCANTFNLWSRRENTKGPVNRKPH